MVVVEKKNGDLRICLDPRDLNQAIQREHYPLPTIEEIATRLERAKVFTVLDIHCGFWHVPLSEESSDLTTFNTLFWAVQMEMYAIWYFSTGGVPTADAHVHRRFGRM